MVNTKTSTQPDYYFLTCKTTTALKAEETIELFHELNKTCKNDTQKRAAIKEKILYGNIPLVINIAKTLCFNDVFTLQDRIQEGTLGLMVAIDKFDVTLGNSFSTYATYWIREYITRFNLNNSRTIRIPEHLLIDIFKIAQTEQKLSEMTGSDFITDEEIAKEIKMSVQECNRLRQIYNSNCLSLSMTYGDDDNITLEEAIPANTKIEEDVVNKMFLQQITDKLFDALDEKELDIIKRRLGFYGECQNLATIGAIYGVTGERIRILESRAIKKMRDRAMRLRLGEQVKYS